MLHIFLPVILGVTPRAVTAVQREEIPGATMVLPVPPVIGRQPRRPEEGLRAQMAVADIARDHDLRRGETTGRGRGRPPHTDPTGGSDPALRCRPHTTAPPTPGARALPFPCLRTGK